MVNAAIFVVTFVDRFYMKMGMGKLEADYP